jgi:dihydropyrimidinase
VGLRLAPTTLITGGLLVTAEGDRQADLYVADGRIAAIGESRLEADRVIDASGRYVLPGCVDVHTHMDLAVVGNFDPTKESAAEFESQSTADDFSSGAEAAAFGGTTTIVDFAEQAHGQTMLEGLAGWHEKVRRGRPVVDVGFHMIVRDLGEDPRAEIAALREEGVTSLKLFTAYKGDLMVDDGVLWETMEIAAATGALTMVHAESGEVIDRLVRRARSRGELAPPSHGATRPAGTEVEAVGRALALAELAGCPLYVVHVSCAGSMERLRVARLAGQAAWGETCTQYLVCDESDLARPGFEGAKFVFTPPPRTEADRERLWEGLRDDVLSVVSSDHSPSNFEGGKTLGRDDFSKIPNGAGGVEERLMVVHHEGVGGGRISLNRMVELLSTNPAKLLGLYPRKGSLAVGSDADVVIFDPDRERTLTAGDLHSRCDYTLYEGMTVRGVPESVMVRGELVVDRGRLAVEPGHGQFISRGTSPGSRDTRVSL